MIALVLLAGLGIDTIKKPQGKCLYITRLIAAGCFAITLGAILAKIYIPDVETTFIVPFIRAGLLGLGFILLILFKPAKTDGSKQRIWSWIIIGLVCFDLISVSWKLNPTIEKEFYQIADERESQGRLYMSGDLEYELRFNKFFLFNSFTPKTDWKFMQDYKLPNLNMLHRREMVNNYDPILPARYQIWMRELSQIDLIEKPDLIAIMAVEEIIVKNANGEIELQNMPGTVEYVRLYDCVISEDSGDNSIALIFDRGIDLRDTVIIEDVIRSEMSCNNISPGMHSVVSTKPGYLKVDVELKEDAWIFFSQEWFPGWTGYIDGEKTEVKRADYIFQAIYCPSGNHTVEFKYSPGSILWGSVLSGVSILIIVLGYAVAKKNRIIS
jgi:hypothetical protein